MSQIKISNNTKHSKCCIYLLIILAILLMVLKYGQDHTIYNLNVNNNDDIDYYQILKVSKSASKKDIKKSYRKLALQCHPDRKPIVSSCPSFDLISKAYDTLSHTEKRKHYDSSHISYEVIPSDTYTLTEANYEQLAYHLLIYGLYKFIMIGIHHVLVSVNYGK